MSEIEIQQSIIRAMNNMTIVQKIKLLETAASLLSNPISSKPSGILKFAGIFDRDTAKEFHDALKECDQIDKNDW